ncbi:hypothetical protein [Roseicella sp. DB1501]|uniref:hypothetical protein n=1 Tax=Roseicella sp. DB1501 TaxID=2730925 RepID=UPI0014910A09|nr:hypothetical protein [Roseicella sp. DB1501]NOG70509.1 hypothetical protein [Roseicella sp. DB1501]
MANLYIVEYTGAGQQQGGVMPALKGYVGNQSIALANAHAETQKDFTKNTEILRLKNEGAVTCYYKLGPAATLSSYPATTSDRPLLPGEVEDIDIIDVIRKLGEVGLRLSVVTA